MLFLQDAYVSFLPNHYVQVYMDMICDVKYHVLTNIVETYCLYIHHHHHFGIF
ncbi:hypothetical protein AmDm5_0866 [Acetobacter malorum]|nr:hypothetical protein AmDm5_0866 [Acetobacter malorum]